MDTEGLSIICAGLGLAEEDDNGNLTGYTKNEYCLDNLKDLQRFLRRDDPQRRNVFRQICKWNTVFRDLIPIIKLYQSDRNLLINAVKILVFLTMPIDPTSDDIAQQMEYLWDLKGALTRNVTIAVIVELLEDPLDHLEHDAFTEDDWKLVQLVLTLFRNILSIQGISLQQKAVGSATRFLCLRDRFLEIMFQENVMDLILVLTQHIDGSSGYLRQDNLLLLEIFHYIFLGQDPELISRTSIKGRKVDGDIITSVDSLRSMMEEEEEKRRTIRLRNLERHSQFSGTFTRVAMDGSKTLFKGNPAAASGDGLLKAHKVQRGPLKRIAWDHDSTSLPKENILESLYNFLDQFLTGGYNVLMQSIHDDIKKEHQAIQNSDVILFFQVADFVIAFQHQKVASPKKPNMESTTPEASQDHGLDNLSFHGGFCGPIAATMNDAMFCLVISRWREAFEGLKETNDHKFVSAAISLMKNMIRILDLVLKLLPEDSKEPQTARILLYKIFYDQTDQGLTQFLLNLFKSFDNHKQPKSDLADLLEIIHKVLRLMEKLQARGTLRVSKKSRKSRKKKIAKDEKKVEAERLREEPGGLQNADSLTHETGMPTESVLNSKESIKEHLYESSLTDKEGTSKSDLAMQPLMPAEETGHLRDGSSHVGSDKVCDNLSPALESAMPPQDTMQLNDDSSHMGSDKLDNNLIDLAYETSDSSDDDPPPPVNEVDFDVSKLVGSFVSNAVIQNLCWLLKYYRSNSASTNHYIICMLRRFCDDLEISPMLYQLSVLTTFYDILADKKSSKEYANVVCFLTKFIRKMLKIIKKQPLLFVEILCWKTRKECHYINAEALMCDLVKLKKDIRSWDSEGVNLSNDRGTGPKSIADSLGDDEADFAIPHHLSHHEDGNLSDGAHKKYSHRPKESASKRNSMTSFINNEIDEDKSEGISSDFQTEKASKRQKGPIFDQEQETAIKNLYEKYKYDRQCSRLIAKTLDPDGKISPLQVSCKLRQLGLKVISRKRLSADVPLPVGDDSTGIEDNTFISSDVPNSLKKAENLISKTSSPTRKRIQAFSKEQELEVKNLFERFKNHKKCSHLIANALDADSTYTAAQISRKLKQLGLLVPVKRGSSKATEHSGEERVIDREEHSGEETLLAFKERSKRKKSKISMGAAMTSTSQHKVTSQGHHNSDDEILSTMFKNKRKKSKLSMKEVAMTSMSQHEATPAEDQDSDDATLSTMFKNTVTQQEPAPSPTLNDDDMEAERDPSNGAQDGGAAVFSNGDAWRGQETHGDELEDLVDSGDDVGPVAPRKTGSRRNLKMVIDLEDDE